MSSEHGYIYGRHPVTEQLLRRPREVERVYLANRDGRLADMARDAQHHGIPVVDVQPSTLRNLVGDVPHQGVVAQVKAFQYAEVEDLLELARKRDEAPLIVALDQIQDPHNLGSIIRSAHCFGAHGVVILKDRACEVTPAVVKAAAGGVAHMGIARVTNLRRCLDELKAAGLWIVGTTAEDGQPLDHLDLIQPTVLVVGGEGQGMRRLTTQTCDMLANIPIGDGVGSLNAGVAAAVCLYEASRQRYRAKQ